MRIDLLKKNDPFALHWSWVMKKLHSESPYKLYDSGFYQWLETEWKFKVITSRDECEGYITAFEIDDSTYALLLLKFPLSGDN